MSNYTDKLDEILENVYHKPPSSTKASILALINRDYILKSEVLSAIGEDEELGADWLRAKDGANMNQLRAEIKTKLGLEK